MDNYLDNRKFNSYYAVNAKKEASGLRCYASTLSARHLKDLSTRLRFMDEIDKFIASQLRGIASAQNENDCKQCLFNLREEKRLLQRQETLLRLGSAKVVASAELVNKLDTWGYVINGVGVVLSGFQVIAGFGIAVVSAGQGNVIGMAGGGLLILHGFNSVKEGITNIYFGRNDTVGGIKSGYIATARFMGFDDKVGVIAYSVMDLALSGYGMGRLILKPNAWRLFQYIPSDYVRSFRTMSAPSLFMEGVGDAITIKSAYDSAK